MGSDEVLLKRKVREVLDRIAKVVATFAQEGAAESVGYSADSPCLRVLSSLAEGADRTIADEALASGFELQAPLPFTLDEYELDFAEADSKHRFRELVDRATATLELDGDRSNAPLAYQRAGRVLLGQSDVLIAIWDGKPAAGIGGTGQVVIEAMMRGLPVVWIHAQSPHGCVLVPPGAEGLTDVVSVERLDDLIRQLFAPAGERSRSLAADYFSPRSHRQYWPPLYTWMRNLLAPPRRPEPVTRCTSDELDVLPHPPTGADRTWADELANASGAAYRDAFVGIYLMGAAAVACALLGYVSRLATTFEFVLIIIILALTLSEKRKHWQEHWIQYRLLSEQFRQMEILWPLGGVLPSFHPPVHAIDAEQQGDWVNWLFRARLRETGMASARLTRQYLDVYRRCSLKAMIDDQASYHSTTAERSHRIETRLHRLTAGFFLATLAACIIHATKHLLHGGAESGTLEELLKAAGTPENAMLTVLAALAPALGAAISGISGQGEFARIRRRSASMKHHLESLSVRLSQASMPVTSDALGSIAENASQVMTEELFDWRVTVSLKELELG